MSEKWVHIEGYENIYMISSLGRILLLPIGDTTPKVMKQQLDKYGYKRIKLTKNSESKFLLVHRLVCSHFVSPCPGPEYDANHKDSMRTHNTPDNLEWLLHNEHNQGERSGNSKLTDKAVKEIWKLHHDGLSNVKISKIYGVCPQLIDGIIGGKRWTHITI